MRLMDFLINLRGWVSWQVAESPTESTEAKGIVSFSGSSFASLVFSVLAVIFATQTAQAATKTWNAGGPVGDWNNPNNWSGGGVPGSGDDVLFNNSAQVPLEEIFMKSDQSINSLTINLTSGSNQSWKLGSDDNKDNQCTLTLATGNISVLSTSGTGMYAIGDNSSTAAGTGIMILETAGTGFTFNNSRTNGGILEIDSIVSGSSKTVTKTGAGMVTFLTANTFTGATIVNDGTLKVASTSGSALGATNGIVVNSGGTLLLGASNQINNSAPITLGGGIFSKGNFSEGGTAAAGVGSLTLSATGSRVDFGTGTVGLLTFASFTPGGNILTIDNWTGAQAMVGSDTTDRLIFASDQSANLSSFNFAGYGPGATQFDLGNGYYELTPAVVPVPEPATYVAALLTLVVVGWGRVVRSRIPSSGKTRHATYG